MSNLHVLKNNLEKAQIELDNYIKKEITEFKKEVNALEWTKNCIVNIRFGANVGRGEGYPYVLQVSGKVPRLDLDSVDIFLEGFEQESNRYYVEPFLTYRYSRQSPEEALIFTASPKQMIDFLNCVKFKGVVMNHDQLAVLTAAKEMEKR